MFLLMRILLWLDLISLEIGEGMHSILEALVVNEYITEISLQGMYSLAQLMLHSLFILGNIFSSEVVNVLCDVIKTNTSTVTLLCSSKYIFYHHGCVLILMLDNNAIAIDGESQVRLLSSLTHNTTLEKIMSPWSLKLGNSFYFQLSLNFIFLFDLQLLLTVLIDYFTRSTRPHC